MGRRKKAAAEEPASTEHVFEPVDDDSNYILIDGPGDTDLRVLTSNLPFSWTFPDSGTYTVRHMRWDGSETKTYDIKV